MENNYQETVDSFDFLSNEEVSSNFADVNIALLQGTHIQSDDFKLYSVLDSYRKEFQFYYNTLYQLPLKRDKKNDVFYYYLDFQDTDKGKLSKSERHHYLTELETIMALMVINMYYASFFNVIKEIHWKDIEKEIKEGENKKLYQKLLFKEIKSGGYTDEQWNDVKKDIRRSIIKLEKLGWIKRLSKGYYDIHFQIRESIHRLENLYQNELTNFETFSDKIKLKKTNEQV
jgi:hypothetical protein